MGHILRTDSTRVNKNPNETKHPRLEPFSESTLPFWSVNRQKLTSDVAQTGTWEVLLQSAVLLSFLALRG